MSITHMCLSIEGYLNNTKRKRKRTDSIFTDESGRSIRMDEARIELHDALKEGKKVLPIGDCDNFDFQTGCKGHKEQDA